jgi:hypothetical protein
MSFLALDAHAKLGQVSLDQRLCVAIVKGYAISFIITYTSEEDLATLNDVLKSVSFSAKPRGA